MRTILHYIADVSLQVVLGHVAIRHEVISHTYFPSTRGTGLDAKAVWGN